MNKLTIILIIVDGLLLLPFLNAYFKKKGIEKAINNTLYQTNNLGFLISLVGDIGKGKSSTMSGLSHAFTLIFQQKIMALFNDTKRMFSKIDFNAFDSHLNLFFSNYVDEKVINFNALTDHLMDVFKINPGVQYNFLDFKKVHKMFKDYIFGYYVIYYRNNYVYSVTNIYSRITNTYSMKYKLDWQRIREAYTSSDYAISDYAVELIDESTDALGASAWRDEEKDESGAKEYRRKYRHIHEERNRMIDARQDKSDMIKRFRTLTQSHIQLMGVEYVNDYKFMYAFIRFILRLPLVPYKLYLRFLWFGYFKWKNKGMSFNEFEDFKYNSGNLERDIENLLFHFEMYFKSISHINVYAKHYHNVDDVGKQDETLFDKLIMYFPIKWAFGTYEQFAFNYIQDELLARSNTKNEESNIFDKKSFFGSNTEKGGDDIVI